mmetsp:Transcript_37954/g.94312  ORF Transcript_37954/g.94312 Transcript_37954/m.94312 type:complete len:263 (-) Transcript_37954:188-976(-)
MAARLKSKMRFLKVPVLEYFLLRYARVLYLDDDVIISPAMGDLFASVSCGALGAVVERHKPQAWHAMHWRAACQLYRLDVCAPKQWHLFNSGVMLLSRAVHLAPLRGWLREQLECRVLCDQLYFNAVVKRDHLRLHDLGASFNFVGSELRRTLVANLSGSSPDLEADRAARRVALHHACVLHLTRKVPKLYTADWVVQRALHSRDVLQCSSNASWPRGRWRKHLLSLMPSLKGKYDIEKEMCDRQSSSCKLLPWVSARSFGT